MSPARTVEVNHSQVTVDDTWSEMDDPADLGQKTSRNETETRTKRCPCENAYKKDPPRLSIQGMTKYATRTWIYPPRKWQKQPTLSDREGWTSFSSDRRQSEDVHENPRWGTQMRKKTNPSIPKAAGMFAAAPNP